MTKRDFQSFGRVRRNQRSGLGPAAGIALMESGALNEGGLLPFGNGKSYGDSCHNDAGILLDGRRRAQILAFDPITGLIEAEAGVLLNEIIAKCAPHGWFLPVTPGTQFVTMGGAIANDVHGKNHHSRGSFGSHVEQLRLLRSDGFTRICSPDENAGYFRATIGGMGLTGLILSARLRLVRVPSLDIAETVLPFSCLDEYFDLSDETDRDNEYAVAWIDQLAHGTSAGRGVLLAGNHADNGNFDGSIRTARLGIPFQPPVTVLNRLFLKGFNAAYRKAQLRKAGQPNTTSWRSYFYPLDAIRNWNLLYGPRGLFQHQSVIPVDEARQAIPRLLEAARNAGQGSFLTVLKRFGEMGRAGLLSFARPGFTLTLDFPNRGRRTLALLNELDRITIDVGGAINPYKDARMSADVFAASFPQWEEFENWRDPLFLSDFWRRTALDLPLSTIQRQAAE